MANFVVCALDKPHRATARLEDQAAHRARLLVGDPYVTADAYASVGIHSFNWGLRNPSIGGAIHG
jgi:uncharacterized protein YciI